MLHRLHERASTKWRAVRGLSCDESGVFFGGDCPLVTPQVVEGRRSYRARPLDEINLALSAGYGVAVHFADRFPTLERLAMLMSAGKWGRAQITALQMRLPELPDDDAVERLLKADRLLRFNPSHYPAGPRGGQFAPRDGVSGEAIAAKPMIGVNPKPIIKPGVAVRLPDGRNVPDSTSLTGNLMSPAPSLADVAEAGRLVGSTYRHLLSTPQAQEGALGYLGGAIFLNVGQGGKFDYQRSGNFITGFQQLRQFRNVANFNVGLFMQQTRLFSLEQTLASAGMYARRVSSNARPSQPHGLDPRTERWIRAGYEAGMSGVYGKAVEP